MNIKPIPAFQSNYLWLIEDSKSAAIVDPGDASPVLETLWSEDLELKYILITHHHPDHVGGIRELKKHFPDCTVYGPANEIIPLIDHKLREDDKVELGSLGTYKILDIPGHTAGHIAYYDSENAFVGDTVFVVGCGRLFEGTPAQMVNSFVKIKQLSPQTKLYCAHEYTMSNIDFAMAAEPDNQDLIDLRDKCAELRKQGTPTVPSTVDQELQTNPFFRCDLPALQESVSKKAGKNINNEVEAFAALRSWKDSF